MMEAYYKQFQWIVCCDALFVKANPCTTKRFSAREPLQMLIKDSVLICSRKVFNHSRFTYGGMCSVDGEVNICLISPVVVLGGRRLCREDGREKQVMFSLIRCLPVITTWDEPKIDYV